jgi:5-methylcytosine-specific restriction enzyme A
VFNPKQPDTMNTYILTWNPALWPWRELEKELAIIRAEGSLQAGWNVYRNFRQIHPGDRVFVLRQSKEPKGIVAAGHATSRAKFNGREWRIKCRIYDLVRPTPPEILPKASLMVGALKHVHWGVQFSGMSLSAAEAAMLEKIWDAHLKTLGQMPYRSPDEASIDGKFSEGAVRTITVNAFERDPRARADCILHHGSSCSVCNFDFEKEFGAGIQGIHVHHLRPLSVIRKRHRIDPIADLRPVCPNCHAVIHSRSPALTINEVRKLRRC